MIDRKHRMKAAARGLGTHAVLALLVTACFGAASPVAAQVSLDGKSFSLGIMAHTSGEGQTWGAHFTVTTEDDEFLGECTLEGNENSPGWTNCRVDIPVGIIVLVREDVNSIPAGYAPVENPITFNQATYEPGPHDIAVDFDNEPQSGNVGSSQASIVASDSATTPPPTRQGTSGPSPEAKVWEQRFGSGGPDHWGTQVLGLAARSGRVYVVGSVPASLPGETFQGGTWDGYIQTYDSKGTKLWGHEMGTRGVDDANAVAVDDSGVYVAGTVSQYLDGPGNDALPGQAYLGEGDAFIRKYDLNGNEAWTRQFGTTDRDQVFAIAVSHDAVYVTGSTDAAFPGSTNINGDDVFVSKFDLNGNEVWTQEFGTGGADQGQTIAVDSTGVYVAGFVGGALPGQTLAGVENVFIRKYDLDGHELWTDEFGSNAADEAFALTTDSSGVYVGGLLGLISGTVEPANGRTSAFVRKYDQQGNLQWSREFDAGESTSTKVKSVYVDSSGVDVSGTTKGALPGQTRQGYEDVFVQKYDSDGNELWTRQYGEKGWAEDVITYTVPGATYASGRVDNDGDFYFDEGMVAQLTP